ncbi:peptidase U61 [Bacillus thuringiensis serovar nigeriensis]|uniref:peptidase U61 n=1 Tax=Bacillus cereus group TaxID=86661 RepID=UPI000A368255|nr:peptidase U61 [Bacillus thuringiensis]MEB8571668.1 peptidase U61 [Bacillus cereus]MEC3429428.1 peptidase U61 [Bacillus cereus]MRC97272.1 peptidase U61 [Bacillus thuringiensis]MRD43497.1 peptidase U61 [Bacillus thuringiensis]OTX23295.1 peptidase U61 [Bacillus thuringiensis serovar nigeriensis]
MKHTIFKYAVIGITTGIIVSLLKKENRKAIQTKGKSVKEKLQEGNIKETLEKVTETSKQFSVTAANVAKQTLPQLLTATPVVISTIKDLTENENNKKKTDEKDYEINKNSKNLDGEKTKNEKKYVKEGKEESA